MKLNRITITLDPELENKLRIKQAKRIKTTKKTCSFSKIIDITLRRGLRVK